MNFCKNRKILENRTFPRIYFQLAFNVGTLSFIFNNGRITNTPIKNRIPDIKYTLESEVACLITPENDIPMTIVPMNIGDNTPFTRPIKEASVFFNINVLIPI